MKADRGLKVKKVEQVGNEWSDAIQRRTGEQGHREGNGKREKGRRKRTEWKEHSMSGTSHSRRREMSDDEGERQES